MLCLHEDARKKVSNLSLVTLKVIWLVSDDSYWELLNQMIMVCKPIIDVIGNLESWDANLADCMLELIKIAQGMYRIDTGPFNNYKFNQHTCTVFNHEFHAMNMDIHALTLFLHPLCHHLAIHQAAKGQSFAHYCTVAVGLAT